MNRKAMVAGAGGALMFGAGAIAQIDSNQPYALGGGRNYVMEDPLVFRHSFFDVFVDDWNWTMTGGPHFPPPPGPPATGTSPAESAAHVTLPGLPPGVPVEGPMFLSFFDVFTEITPGGTQTFDTEMLSMDLTGTVPGVGPFMIRESPTRPSHGRYSVTPIGGGGGYHIDSFFDIWTELSLDGGQTWTPAESSAHFRISPSPGAIGLLGMGALVLGRRRR